MPEPHELLDEAMSARRLELRMNWREVAQAAGISYEALRAIRRGDYRPTELTARGIDEALKWVVGGVHAALDGREPVRHEGVPSSTNPAAPTPGLSRKEETLRLVVRAVARELSLESGEVQQVLRQVSEDLEQGPRSATAPERAEPRLERPILDQDDDDVPPEGLAADVSRVTLQNIEAGRGNPTIATLLKIAHVLGVPLAELVE